jgi:DNA-binding XRE family transcriptional regulator
MGKHDSDSMRKRYTRFEKTALAAFRQGMRERRYREVLEQPPERTLAELRKSCHKTQWDLAASLGVQQVHISRLERRADLRLSTLRRYVEALGGTLDVIVRFPRRALRLTLPDRPATLPTSLPEAATDDT